MRHINAGIIGTSTLAVIALLVYGLFAFIGMQADVTRWDPFFRFFLVLVVGIIGTPSAVYTSALYLDLTEPVKEE